MFYSYLHFKHYLATLSPSLTLPKPIAFELICSQGPHQLYLISVIYQLLHEASPLTGDLHTYMRKWSHIVQQPITLSCWDKILSSTSKVSRCVAQRETAFKVLLFWYRTPEEFSLPLDPLHYLLGLPFPGIGKSSNKLASYILLAAIPIHWLSSTPPSQDQLLKVISEIRRMEHMTALVEDVGIRFNKIWDIWDRSEFGSPPES